MPPKGYTLVRYRRRYAVRNDNWFTITNFNHKSAEALTNPSSKELERQELNYASEEEESKQTK